VVRCAHNGCGRRRPTALVRLVGLGLYFEDTWYCSAPCLDAALRERATASALPPSSTESRVRQPSRVAAPRALRLGALLAHQVGLSPAALAEALDAQSRSGLRIGAQLVRMGAATEHEVLRGLAAQAGVEYLTSLDASELQAGTVLPADSVRALGIVPFAADPANEVIRVACVAPLPRLALSIARHLTGQHVEPFLVSDDRLAALIESYCGHAARRDAGRGASPAVRPGDGFGAALSRVEGRTPPGVLHSPDGAARAGASDCGSTRE